MTDAQPAVLVIDDDRERLDAVVAALGRRYGQDYLIAPETSAEAALRHLAELRDAARPVALIMAAAFMRAADGSQILAQSRGLHPAAKRVLVVPRGGPAAPSLRVPASLLLDRSLAEPILRAMSLGFIDSYLTVPGSPGDEGYPTARLR